MAAKSSLLGCLVVLLFLSFTHFATAAGTEQKTKWLVPRTNITGPNPNDYECESARAADYYGIGVRLGIYFSWITGWVVSWIDHRLMPCGLTRERQIRLCLEILAEPWIQTPYSSSRILWLWSDAPSQRS
ncbi:hypothetical protein PV04_02923 [Phialophora macrospora]|uniref:Uncharacterized protein n=1 Tax=Phialophora macrospora TaxID=1851006 RepID=A0A0D2FQQ7_9EURO|nr:hypothetical protein PV04_02923 [Phialophora macrospora]